MNDQILKWVKAAPLPMLILGAYVYAYSIDAAASQAAKDAAVAMESKRDQAERLKRIEEKLDSLTTAVAELNRVTSVRLTILELAHDKKEKK